MTKFDDKTVGWRICELRIEKGLSQSELAQRSNTSAAYIYKLEAGKRDPKTRTLRRVVTIGLQVPMSEFWRGIESRVTP